MMMIEDIDGAVEEDYSDAETDKGSDSEYESEETTEAAEAGDIDRTDLLKMYLREASRAPMLNAAGEVAAAKKIERGRFRLMKLGWRSPIIAQYCAHFRSVLSQGEMSAADAIERAPGYDVSNSALLGELADNALSEVEMAYENLAGAK